jgi:hypothetical protein
VFSSRIEEGEGAAAARKQLEKDDAKEEAKKTAKEELKKSSKVGAEAGAYTLSVRAQLEQLQDTFMSEVGLYGLRKSSS